MVHAHVEKRDNDGWYGDDKPIPTGVIALNSETGSVRFGDGERRYLDIPSVNFIEAGTTLPQADDIWYGKFYLKMKMQSGQDELFVCILSWDADNNGFYVWRKVTLATS